MQRALVIMVPGCSEPAHATGMPLPAARPASSPAVPYACSIRPFRITYG